MVQGRERPMNITFNKLAKQRVYQWIKRSLADSSDPHCPFCQTPITGRNFRGAALINDELRAFDGSLMCLMELSKEVNL